MKERPILFSGAMVRALLAGTKTQTRRIAKPVRHPDLGNMYSPGALVLEHEPRHVIERACPYGLPGDRLWVRETWQGPLLQEFEVDEDADWHTNGHIYQYQNPAHCEYAADGGPPPEYTDVDEVMRQGWRPSIHMPRWASRITLEITNVHLERLHEISNSDARAEGCDHEDPCDHVRQTCAAIGCPGPDYRVGFRSLWERINGPDSWHANPWIWAIRFHRIEQGAA